MVLSIRLIILIKHTTDWHGLELVFVFYYKNSWIDK